MIHGTTITLEDLNGQQIPIEILSKALIGFPYKFISPKAHRYYVEFETVQLTQDDFINHLESKQLFVLLSEPSLL